MATLIVTTKDDTVNPGDGVLSLREAVGLANSTAGADTIQFALAIEKETLVLSGGELSLTQDTVLDGDQNNDGIRVTLDGTGGMPGSSSSRHINIAQGNTVDLVDLNFVNGNDGSVDCSHAVLRVDNCQFSHNTTSNNGGTIYAYGGNITISSSIFTENHADNRGGAISGKLTDVSISDSMFESNSAFIGGAINITTGNLSIVRSEIINNLVVSGSLIASGGGISHFNGDLTILQSTIAGNQGPAGAGLSTQGSNLRLFDSTIANNLDGGGLLLFDATSIINGCTIIGNNINNMAEGGGIRIFQDNADLTLENSIIAGNFAIGSDSPRADISGTVDASNGHNIFGSDVTGRVAGDLGNVSTDVLFAGGLADNGGPTQTIALLDDPTNPALGGADPADATATDQRGVARPLPAGTNPDIGAFELTQTVTGPTVILGTNRSETLLGTAGDDLMRAFGGNDILRGFGGDDQLFGGNGNDLLLGKGGLDRMHGGAGADKFALRLLSDAPANGPAYDEVLDFSRAQHDLIDFSRLDAKGGVPGNQAFTFIGTAEFSAAGQLRYEVTADGDFLVSGSADRDLDAEFAVLVHTDLAGLKAADFLL